MTENSVSWSEIKTYQRCPKQHEYKYIQRLVPKLKKLPLYKGSWIHKAIEAHYKGQPWMDGFNEYLVEYDALFDEEKAELNKRGNLPDQIKRILQSYFWYYKNDGWEPTLVEQKFEIDLPFKIDGSRQRLKGILDLGVTDEEGLDWVVDHKTTTMIPQPNSYHATDPQLMIYPWAAEIAWGKKYAGVVYNYIRSRAPSIPQLTKGGQLSRRKVLTDYPTLVRFYRSVGLDPNEYADILRPLQKRSPFLRRYRLPREPQVTREILTDIFAVIKHIRVDKRRTRTITKDCATQCAYHDICRAELNGFDTTIMRNQMFTLKEEDGDRPDRSVEITDEGDEG